MPDISTAEINAVTEVLMNGWLTTGQKTLEFQDQFSNYIGSSNCLAVNSCTAALHLALDAVGVKEGDEVIIPTMTFAATGEVVSYMKARPVLVDCDPVTFNLNPSLLLEALSNRTKAIIPVHMAGHPCDMDPILEFSRAHGISVIEDSAHALPASYKGRSVGIMGDIGCFSFYPTKTITTGEGGMVVTNNVKYADRMRLMSLHGISRDAWKRYAQNEAWRYEIEEPGYKYNLTDIASALGTAQLARADAFNERRRKIAELYNESFAGLEGVSCPKELPENKHSWHLYILRIHSDRIGIGRDGFIEEMKKSNIGTSVHFIPLHMHAFYRKTYGYVAEQFPVASLLAEEIVSLPLYTKMTDADVTRVIDTVSTILREST